MSPSREERDLGKDCSSEKETQIIIRPVGVLQLGLKPEGGECSKLTLFSAQPSCSLQLDCAVGLYLRLAAHRRLIFCNSVQSLRNLLFYFSLINIFSCRESLPRELERKMIVTRRTALSRLTSRPQVNTRLTCQLCLPFHLNIFCSLASYFKETLARNVLTRYFSVTLT
jgi:hypothetical protein